MSTDWLGYGYAALVASGGVIGYAKAGSVPSLAAGLLFGGLAGVGAYQQSQDPKNVWLSLIASGTLTGVMGMRFYNSRKFMPAGLIAGASPVHLKIVNGEKVAVITTAAAVLSIKNISLTCIIFHFSVLKN
uniref:Transmembrane protein 14C n=1 Tax=Podarcis muralis TaxID=64176 RepID=A0A670I6K2_PODMU